MTPDLHLDSDALNPRLVIVTRRPFLQAFIAEMLKANGGELVASFSTHAELLRDVNQIGSANVLLLDATQVEGLYDLLLETRKTVRGCRSLVATNAAGDYVLNRVFECGAGGIVNELDACEEWIDAIRAVSRGGSYQSAVCVRQRDVLPVAAKLTPMEAKVLPLVCKGMTDEGVGQALGIAPLTVEGHRSSCMRKLGAADSAALLVLGVVLGVVGPSEIDVFSRVRRSAGGARRK